MEEKKTDAPEVDKVEVTMKETSSESEQPVESAEEPEDSAEPVKPKDSDSEKTPEDDSSDKKEPKDPEKKKSAKKADPEKVKEDISSKKGRISALKDQLNEIDAEKEGWYKKKEEYGKQIVELIKDVKARKGERDQFTRKVRESKAERLDHSNILKTSVNDVKKLKDKLKSVTKGNKVDPISIKKQMDKLQTTMETEVMSFEAEKKLMKKVRELQKEFEGSKESMKLWEEIRTKSKVIDELKRKMNTSHRLVQDQAKLSQQKHEDMIKNSNTIDEIKKKEEEAYKKFFELKQKFVEVNNELKGILNDLNQVNRKADKIKADTRKEKRKKENIVLKDKETEINEKIKNKEKLTTEDLLTLQQIEMRKK